MLFTIVFLANFVPIWLLLLWGRRHKDEFCKWQAEQMVLMSPRARLLVAKGVLHGGFAVASAGLLIGSVALIAELA